MRTRHVWPATLMMSLLLFGCATARSAPKKRSLYQLTPAAWQEELQARGVDPREVPHPLAVTESIKEDASKLAGSGSVTERLAHLQTALFDANRFPFQYENRRTLTAAEAYHGRRGNCLSFTNLFVAMARSLGIPATTAMVLRARGSEREGDLIVVNSHVIAAVVHGGGTHFYDFDISRDTRPAAIKLLDDMWITALYLNNLGAEELRAGRPDTAVRHFENAVKLAPEFAGAWGNLGVGRRRLGDAQGAFDAYTHALTVETDNPTVLTNLAALFRAQGKEREATLALSAGNLSRASPHLLILHADLLLAQGREKDALATYRRATRLAPRLADAWTALAAAELSLGRTAAGRKHLTRALRLQPTHAEARRMAEELAASRGGR